MWRLGNHLYLLSLAAREMLRHIAALVVTSPFMRWRFAARRSVKLNIAPQDLRTADPTVAAEIYAGRFAFAGKFVAAGGRSPFELYPPTREWAEALYGFGWLRHLRAADSALARANAKALVGEWIDLHGRWHQTAWAPEITARRVLAWLAQSPVVLENADFAFYRKFVVSLSRQVSYLAHMRRLVRPGSLRLQLVIAIAQAALCLDAPKLQKRARRWLENELQEQILSDGIHVSRNPALLLQLLLDLLPLRHSYVALSQLPPQALLNAIDRMMPMIRFFRHGDGAFALFNGMGPTPADIVATLLAYDETRGAPPAMAPASGYLRLEAGPVTLLMDGGAPAPVPYSSQAHAGTLSFEFSDGADRVVVNCGMPWAAKLVWQSVARSTAAHSTAVIAARSSASFASSRALLRWLGPVMVQGPDRVEARLQSHEITASHDGYAEAFGIVHQRRLQMRPDGGEISGVDELQPVRENLPQPEEKFAVRFHLHPHVKASLIRDGECVLLVLPGRQAWEFHAVGFKAAIEESLYLGGADGARRSEQIVLHGNLSGLRDVRWRFTRHTVPVHDEAKSRPQSLPLPL